MYSIDDRVNDILDKISKYGLESINSNESSFLDRYSKGLDVNDLMYDDYVYIDDNGNFKFEYNESKVSEDKDIYHYGVLYVPDLVWRNGKTIKGRLEGKIISHINGTSSLDFYSDRDYNGYIYDIFEFCGGLEFELDTFIDYVISDILLKMNNYK